MIKFLKLFRFLPFIKRLIDRKYYATGIGTYILNSFSKQVFRINTGDFLSHFSSRITNSENVKLIGDNLETVYLSFATSGGCYYQALNGLEISEGSIWSYNCCFVSANHSFKDLNKHEVTNPIRIGKYVWLGANCVVLPAVQIGDYSIIGAGSIVNKDVPPYSIAVGNPARVVAKRCTKCLERIGIDESCNSCSAS